MIFGYSPTKTRSRFFRKFQIDTTKTKYHQNRLFKRSINQHLIYTLFFWFFLLFSLRVGSIAFFGMVPGKGPKYGGLSIRLPNIDQYHVFSGKSKRTIFIWIDRNNEIAINNNNFGIIDLKYILMSKYSNRGYRRAVFRIDQETKMEVFNKLIVILRKIGINKFIFVTGTQHINFW